MPITVDLKNGDRIKGQFEGPSPSELSLRTHSAQAEVPRSEIQKITIPKLDGLSNGTWIGAGIVGMIAFRQPPASGPLLPIAAAYMGPAAGLGALIDLGVDAIHMGEVVLYQAP